MTNPLPGRTLVIGATGGVGREVALGLTATGRSVRALTRRPQSAGLPAEIEVAPGDLADLPGLRTALDGIDAVFLMWPFQDATLAPEIIDAIAAQANHCVLLSSGAAQDELPPEQHPSAIGRWHAAVEQTLMATQLQWTILRPSGFATNTRWWARQIRTGDIVRGAYGAIRTTPIHEKDMAAVAVHALIEEGHHGERYRLTGPRVLTHAEQVEVIGQALGRPLRWQELSRAEHRDILLADPSFPDSFVDTLLDRYASMLDAPTPPVTTDVEKVTGRPPRDLLEWVTDHADEFR